MDGFSKNYKLAPLDDIEQYILINQHLPNTPSSKEVEMQVNELGKIIKIQQEKIDGLNLYLVEQDKRIEKLNRYLKNLNDLQDQEQLKGQLQILQKKQ